MPYKNKKWPEIKAGKTTEQRQSEGKAYNNRRQAKEALRDAAAKIIEDFFRYSFLGMEGMGKNLRWEIWNALRLPYGWDQKDYDNACVRLGEIRRKMKDLIGRRREVNLELLDAILVIFRLSKVSAEEKLSVLMEAMLRIGNNRESGEVTKCQKNMANFVHALCRQIPEVYPDWFPDVYAKQASALLRKEDKKKVIKVLQDDLDKENESKELLEMFEFEDENKDEGDIVF